MTFHGKPRASADVMHHVHESPKVMLVPLYVLAAGALFAGVDLRRLLHRRNDDAESAELVQWFWRDALFAGPENEILEHFHHVPSGSARPFVMMVDRLRRRLVMYIRSPDLPKQLARSQPGLYAFLLNKWYFDEIYDFLFVRSAKALGRFLWKKGEAG